MIQPFEKGHGRGPSQPYGMSRLESVGTGNIQTSGGPTGTEEGDSVSVVSVLLSWTVRRRLTRIAEECTDVAV